MYSKHHLVISVVVAVPLAVALSASLHPAVVVAAAVAAGVGIDLDHFLLARYNTGSWAAFRRAVSNPRLALVNQSELFESGEVGTVRRLLSHVALGGVAIAALAVAFPGLAVVVAVSLYAHLLADLVWDDARTVDVVTHGDRDRF